MNKILLFQLLFLFPVMVQGVWAYVPQEKAPSAEEIVDADAAKFSKWLVEFKKTARRKHGLSEAVLEAAFAGVKYESKVVEADRKQPEFVRTFWSYLDAALSQERIANGKLMMERHAKLLDEVSKKYNVQPHILVAFWGMETNYGRNLGNHDVIAALATLSFDDRRSAFFTEELVAALKILEAGHTRRVEFKGSWAGAFGNFQFLPSVFLRHAVDGGGDGKIDLYGDIADSFASAANYLSKMGWDGRYKWGRPVSFAERNMKIWRHVNSGEAKPLSFFAELGVRAHGGGALPRGEIPARLVAPNGAYGPAFVVYDNFQLIMRWNASVNYAIAVGMLSDTLVSKPMPVFARRPGWENEKPLAAAEVKEVQEALRRLGLFEAGATGFAGKTTMAAVKKYQEMLIAGDGKVSPLRKPVLRYKSGRAIVPDGYASADVHEMLVK